MVAGNYFRLFFNETLHATKSMKCLSLDGELQGLQMEVS